MNATIVAVIILAFVAGMLFSFNLLFFGFRNAARKGLIKFDPREQYLTRPVDKPTFLRRMHRDIEEI